MKTSSDFIDTMTSKVNISTYGDVEINYLDHYWITREELLLKWCDVLCDAFDILTTDSRNKVKRKELMDIRATSYLFDDESAFNRLIEAGRISGATSFAIVEDIGEMNFHNLDDWGFFRISFNIDSSWDNLSNGSGVAYDIFRRPIRSFFVISDNGCVGKYVDNDAENSFEVFFTSNMGTEVKL